MKKVLESNRTDRSINNVAENSPVNALSKIRFHKDFANVKNVIWKRSDNFDVASFTQNGQREKAYFGMNSQLIGTITPKTYTDLPQGVMKEINEDYKNYALGPVVYFNAYESNTSQMVLYSDRYENSDSYFVELVKGSNKIVLRVNSPGDLGYYGSV